MKATLRKIKILIQNGDLDNAGRQLLDYTQKYSSRFYNEVVGHIANLKQVVSDERKGIVSVETTIMNKNRITYALLDLIDDIDEELAGEAAFLASKPFKKGKEIKFEGSVGQVIIQQSRNGDNVAEKKVTNEKVIEIGSNAHITAPIIIADNIENSFNLLSKSNITDNTRELLKQLLHEINEINKKAIPEQSEIAEEMARDAENLVKEVTSSKPRRKWYEVSIEGLKKAATNIGEVATPVLEIVGKLTPILLP